jgi:hypothetical protein
MLDPGTNGVSSGTSQIVSSPSSGTTIAGQTRQYAMSYSNNGGEIYFTSFASDPKATHFVYEAYVWIENPSLIGALEMDLNQVISNGRKNKRKRE